MNKRLYRSRQHNVIAGVCGGLGEYFDVDPVFVRILAVILVFAHGIGLVAYIVAWIAMPKSPLVTASVETVASTETPVDTQPPAEPSVWAKYWVGIILIGLGVIFLADHLFWWFHWRYVWPILLILAGAALILRSSTRHKNNGGIHESIQS